MRDVVEEAVPDSCGGMTGLREFKVPHRNLTLNAVSFGSCDETLVMVSNITVTANRSAISADYGDTVLLKATVMPANATDKSVTWSVDDTSLAIIDPVTGILTVYQTGQ